MGGRLTLYRAEKNMTDDQIAQLLVANMTVMERLIYRLETGQPIVRQELAAELDDIASLLESPTGVSPFRRCPKCFVIGRFFSR